MSCLLNIIKLHHNLLQFKVNGTASSGIKIFKRVILGQTADRDDFNSVAEEIYSRGSLFRPTVMEAGI